MAKADGSAMRPASAFPFLRLFHVLIFFTYCFFSSMFKVVALPEATVTLCSFGPVKD